MSESRALTQHSASGEVAVFNLSTFELMRRVASEMALAPMLPDHLKGKNPDETRGNCFLIVNQAYSWRMNPVAVASSSYLVHGKLGFEGKLVAAAIENMLGIKLKMKFDGEKGTPQRRITVWDPNDTNRDVSGTVGEWATKDKEGKLTRQWQVQPDDQLIYRGTRQWCRRHEPAIILGIYTGDELEDAGHHARDVTPRQAARQVRVQPRRALAPPPDIPDAAQPPIVPGAISPSEPDRSDADFLAALDNDLIVCALDSDIDEVIEANKAEVEQRGAEQAANDLVERHRARIAKAATARVQPKLPAQIEAEEAYASIGRAMHNADSLATLAEVWKLKQTVLKTLPEAWQHELTAEKDRLKAQLQRQS